MKHLFISFLFIVFGISINAQNLDEKYFIKSQESPLLTESPILIVNNKIIGNSILIKRTPTESILNIEFSKEDQLSTTKLYTPEIEKRGILKIEIEEHIKVEIKTQNSLNIFFGLKETNDIYINGYLINKEYSISTESIISIEIMKADEIFLKTSSLNIII